MYRTYTLRIRPNKTQVAAFEFILKDSCETYNAALQERIEAWKLQRKSVTLYDQFKELTQLRQDPQFATIAADIQREPLRRLDLAMRGFFARVKRGDKPGFPRYRSLCRYTSFCFGEANLPVLCSTFIRVPSIKRFRFKCSRQIQGKPKTAIIKRLAKRWIVRLTCDIGPTPDKPIPTNPIGVDVGLSKFLTLSDGRSVTNPRWIRRHEAKIAAANRLLARKQKRSKNRVRALEVLRRAHQRLADQRKDFTHHISRWLVNRYALIAFEKLDIKGMLKGDFAKSILDVAWKELFWQLAYKAEYAGKWAVAVDPKGTTQRCSGCGVVVKKTLRVRTHRCSCGLVLDRDHNAALNILALGRSVVDVSLQNTGVTQ